MRRKGERQKLWLDLSSEYVMSRFTGRRGRRLVINDAVFAAINKQFKWKNMIRAVEMWIIDAAY